MAASMILVARNLRSTMLPCLLLLGTASAQDAAPKDIGIQASVDHFFGTLVAFLGKVLFFTLGDLSALPWSFFGGPNGIPMIILVLLLGGVFFTLRYGFVNFRLFSHAIYVVAGHFDDPKERGEVSHFQALMSALAATIGLGNIAGVALANSAGGPGAVFWMWVMAFFGMTLKFSECTLALLYREIKPDGHVLGGPMIYLRDGLIEVNPKLKPLAYMFSYWSAGLTILAAFAAGNMFQVQQMYVISTEFFGVGDDEWFRFTVGLVVAGLVAMVTIGGIKRIGKVSGALVPTMCLGYMICCLIVILSNITLVPALLASIVVQAFNPDAMFGGFIGVLVVGMKRAAFSNEAGLGSAPIAHAAAKTHEPVREGTVAMLGPFIDTIIVCTCTALTILITNAHLDVEGLAGVKLTSRAFATVSPYMNWFLVCAIYVFAYSTIIGWGYYGERATEYIFGDRGLWPYRIIYVLVTVVSPMLTLASVVDFADMMMLTMAFPNILGMLFLAKKINGMKNDYMRRLESGEIKPLR